MKSKPGEVFYLEGKPWAEEGVVETLRLDSVIPKGEGACFLLFWAHSIESISFLEKVRYGHEVKQMRWVSRQFSVA